jgi:hypothetical protein
MCIRAFAIFVATHLHVHIDGSDPQDRYRRHWYSIRESIGKRKLARIHLETVDKDMDTYEHSISMYDPNEQAASVQRDLEEKNRKANKKQADDSSLQSNRSSQSSRSTRMMANTRAEYAQTKNAVTPRHNQDGRSLQKGGDDEDRDRIETTDRTIYSRSSTISTKPTVSTKHQTPMTIKTNENNPNKRNRHRTCYSSTKRNCVGYRQCLQ